MCSKRSAKLVSAFGKTMRGLARFHLCKIGYHLPQFWHRPALKPVGEMMGWKYPSLEPAMLMRISSFRVVHAAGLLSTLEGSTIETVVGPRWQ
jgi:hypothetical protein